jgi:hypothetical protein
MNWPLAVAIAWVAVMVPVSYLIGTSMRRADRRDRPADPVVELLAATPSDPPAGGDTGAAAPDRVPAGPPRIPALPAKRSAADTGPEKTPGPDEG